MKCAARSQRWTFLLLFFTLFIVGGRSSLATPQTAGAPEILKVEPPNWWIDHSINPVRVLIHGRNLTGARVEGSKTGIQIGPPRVNETGTYIFVDVRINPQATPGSYPLKIVTSKGTTPAPFDILAPLPRAGRFQGFSPDDVIYLIMPDRFSDGDPSNDDPSVSRGLFNRQKPRYYHGGDIQGIINHLPYLKDLGVTALWMNPIYDNVNHLNDREKYDNEPITDYHGYGAVDFYGVEEHFGDMAKLRELVEAAHRLGIKVIQDQVANHTGPYHPWVKDPPTPTWYNGTEAHHLNETWQTWTLLDLHATPQVQESTLRGWFVDILPDLNQDDPETSRYLIQNTLWWIGMTGFDGIRQDTLPYVPRRFWRDWMAAIKREYPHLRVVGEMWDGDASLVSFFQGGKTRFDGVDSGVDGLFDFPMYYPLRRAFAEGKPLRDLAALLARDYLYTNPNMLVTFLGLHDVARFMNEPGANLEGMKLAFTFLMTARGIPLIYYGDEIGMHGGNDPDNRRDFPGGWAGDPQNAFEASGRTPEAQSIFEQVRRLTHLRAEIEPLRRGRMLNLAGSEQAWAFARITSKESAIVVFNNDSKQANLEFPIGPTGLSNGDILSDRLGVAPDVKVEDGTIRVILPPRSASIYTVKPH
ncbi:MAG: alpha-amylase family glycosyl hydrolase [Terriglobia bacterium]